MQFEADDEAPVFYGPDHHPCGYSVGQMDLNWGNPGVDDREVTITVFLGVSG